MVIVKDYHRRPCSIFGCTRLGKYALYELFPDKTKVWRTDLCDEHELQIAQSNLKLKEQFDIKEFKEVSTIS
jgi:hypothetical protein